MPKRRETLSYWREGKRRGKPRTKGAISDPITRWQKRERLQQRREQAERAERAAWGEDAP